MQKIKGFTLFATHYHEITALAKSFPQFIKNGHMEIQQGKDNDITFSYVFKEGSVGRSYGIQVAELAGLPESLIQRAKQSLALKESQKLGARKSKEIENQLSLFVENKSEVVSEYADVVARLKTLDLNTLSPIESLLFLSKIQAELKAKELAP